MPLLLDVEVDVDVDEEVVSLVVCATASSLSNIKGSSSVTFALRASAAMNTAAASQFVIVFAFLSIILCF
ncbi:MAG: hypothetical protein ACK5HT_05365 [Draconibacterium sp.]